MLQHAGKKIEQLFVHGFVIWAVLGVGSLLLFCVVSAGVAQMRLMDLLIRWLTNVVSKLLVPVS